MRRHFIYLLSCIIVLIVMGVGIILLSASGQKNSLPYKSWKSRDEMIKVLGDDYLYPTYLPAGESINKAIYNSYYIDKETFLNLFPRDETAKNFNNYNIFYYIDSAVETSPDKWLNAVNITFQRNEKGSWELFYQTADELKQEPLKGYKDYIFVLKDKKEELDDTTIFISAYYTQENTSFFHVFAYCFGENMLSRFQFDYNRGNNMGISDQKYSEKEEAIIQHIKAEISKTIKSLEPSIIS